MVNLLASKLELYGFKAVLCPSDADTTIVKKSLQVQDRPVIVLADDTDMIRCLLLHHAYHSNEKREIYMKNIHIQGKNNERVSYNIHDIINSIGKEYLEHLLVCHAFTGCHTTSQILNFGKKSIFSKLKIS